jgi:acyl carrier protein
MPSSEVLRSADTVRTWLTERVAAQLDTTVERIRPDVLLAEYGLDSVYALTLAVDIEDHLGVRVDATAVWDYPTVEELTTFLVGELAGKDV